MQKLITQQTKLALAAILLFQISVASGEFHGTITGTTNYVWRAYSKSNNEPAIQANLDYSHDSGFFIGTSVSSFNIGPSEILSNIPGVDFNFPNSARAEIIPYVGWSFKLADNWRLDTQFSRYFYEGKIYSKIGDYNEYYLFVHYKDLVTVMASYADDFYGIDGDSYFFELTGRYPLTDYLQFSTTLGYAKTSDVVSDDYQYWNVGLTGTYKFLSLDLRYHGAQEVEVGDDFGLPDDHPITLKDTVVLSISAGF